MITLTGTYGKANETAPTGYVDIQPMVTAVLTSTIITQAPVRATLDGDGAISTEILASDDAGWDNGPIPYIFREFIDGQVAQWMAYVNGPGPVDMADLIPLTEAPALAPADWPSFDYSKTTDALDIPDTWTQVNALDVDVVAGGTYIFAVSLTWHFDVTNRSALFRFSRDGGQSWGDEYSVEPGDNTDVYPFFYSYPVTYAAAESLQIVMQARKESATGVLDVSFCDLWMQRVQ